MVWVPDEGAHVPKCAEEDNMSLNMFRMRKLLIL